MKQRAITAVFIIIGMTATLFLSSTVVYPLVLSLLSLIGCYEVLKVFSLHRELPIAIGSYVVSSFLPALGYVLRSSRALYLVILCLAVYVFLFYMFAVAVFRKGKVPFGKVAAAFAMVTYVTTSFSALSIIRHFADIGLYCLGIVLVGAWISDVFAYLVGSLIGKHKLIPEVSPKKTVEGSIGGVVFATGAMALYGYLVGLFTDILPFATALKPNYLFLCIAGFVVSVISQLGDLLASVVKREYGIKDYGSIFPGHGGVMDRFDSIIAVSVATMVICLFIEPFSVI
jgi:phosphatidate cytidylyltransferase